MLVLLTLPHLLISRKCVVFLCYRCWSRSFCLTFSSTESTCFSSVACAGPAHIASPRQCVFFLCHPCWSRSLCLAFSSLGSAWFSSVAHAGPAHFASPSPLQRVCGFPLLPVLVLLTLPHSPVASWCVLSLCCLSWSHSLFIAFSFLGSACFSSVACAGLTHFALPR
jgi:hypothetical protein